MPEHCMPKAMLFGWLCQPRPRPGPRKQWRNIKVIEDDESEWHQEVTTSRETWRTICAHKLRSYDDHKGSIAANDDVTVLCEVSKECLPERAIRKDTNALLRD